MLVCAWRDERPDGPKVKAFSAIGRWMDSGLVDGKQASAVTGRLCRHHHCSDFELFFVQFYAIGGLPNRDTAAALF